MTWSLSHTNLDPSWSCCLQLKLNIVLVYRCPLHIGQAMQLALPQLGGTYAQHSLTHKRRAMQWCMQTNKTRSAVTEHMSDTYSTYQARRATPYRVQPLLVLSSDVGGGVLFMWSHISFLPVVTSWRMPRSLSQPALPMSLGTCPTSQDPCQLKWRCVRTYIQWWYSKDLFQCIGTCLWYAFQGCVWGRFVFGSSWWRHTCDWGLLN